ncbi:hypothetical protein OF83DRAFT_1180733 [Amylostereum chailletii]|nr:hypothetical protein OF83DRAFT_1180733 [Amylostereum chailletii]
MKEIPHRYVPTLSHQNKPLLHWGLAFTNEQVLTCLLRNNLMPDWDPKKPKIMVALFKVLDYLEDRCGVTLKREWPLSVDYPHVVSLYSNFSMADTVMPWKTEERAVAIIKEELGVEGDTMWWWNWEKAYKRW